MASKIKLENANGKIVTIENNDSNMSDVTLNGASITKKVDTLADMRAMNELPETVWCSGYHSKNDGAFGSHFYRLKGLKTTETDNSGTVIVVSVGGSDYAYELQFDGAVNVKWFGAKGDGVTDDTIAIQNTVNSLGQLSFTSSGDTYIGSTPKIEFEQKHYKISDTITIPHAYVDIDFNDAIITPHASFDLLKYAFDFKALWRGTVEGFKLSGFDYSVKQFNNNFDQGKILFYNFEIHGGIVGIQTKAESSKISMHNFLFDNISISLHNKACDHLDMSFGWIKEGVAQADYDGNILHEAGTLYVNDLLHVPSSSQTKLNTCVIKAYSSVVMDKVRFGGEPGNRTILNSFIQGNLTDVEKFIKLVNSNIYTASDTSIVLYRLPNSILVNGCTGFTDNINLIKYDETFASIDSEIARVTPLLNIQLSGLSDNNKRLDEVTYRKLAPYINYGDDFTSYGYTDNTSTAAPISLKFKGNRNSIEGPFSFTTGTMFMVYLRSANPTNDASSIYLVVYRESGNFDLTPILLGTSTVAPRLVLDGSLINVVSNSTAPSQFYYSVVKVSGR